MNNQNGFTLIELVVVIVILGLLSAVAVPKFIDIQTEAEVASADGVFGGANSATALNHAEKLVKDDSWTGTEITDGTSLIGAMEGLPDGWAVDDTGGVGNVGICVDPDTTDSGLANEEVCDAETYFISIVTLGDSALNGTANTKAALSKNW